MNPSLPSDPALLASLQRLASRELSLSARLGHVALVLVSLAMTVIVVSLWLTEPGLPVRTSAVFVVFAAIGLGWTAFGVWVLSARRLMFATQRVVASRLAVAFSLVFTAGTIALAVWASQPAAWLAGGMGAVMSVVALSLWWRATRAYKLLLNRRGVLAASLDKAGAR